MAPPMLRPATADGLRRRRLIPAGVAIALLLIAFVMSAVLVHRSHASSSGRVDPEASIIESFAVESGLAVAVLPGLWPGATPRRSLGQRAIAAQRVAVLYGSADRHDARHRTDGRGGSGRPFDYCLETNTRQAGASA